MISFIQRLGAKFLKFIVDSVCKLTLLATLVSASVCIALFFLSFFSGEPVYAVISLAGLLSFVYVNKQF